MPQIQLQDIIAYWCLAPQTSQFIAEHCTANRVLQQANDVDAQRCDAAGKVHDDFVHTLSSGTQYVKLVRAAYAYIGQRTGGNYDNGKVF